MHSHAPDPHLFSFDIRSLLARDPTRTADHGISQALAAVASRIGRAFAIVSPFAPGLVCCGAEVALGSEHAGANGAPGLSATGTGDRVWAAISSCLGEAAELLSQFERAGDVVARGGPNAPRATAADGWMADALRRTAVPVDWVEAADARSGDVTTLPADFCVRRAPSRRVLSPVGALSSGVAAGPTKDAATLRAVLELCERDALALWWIFGRRARILTPDHPVSDGALGLVETLRQGSTGRVTTLFDISTDLGIPTVAAVSTDLDGRGLACGAAARLDTGDAARAAVLEMCQMELSAPLAARKRREGGEDALNDADRRHLRRAGCVAATCPPLVPEHSPSREALQILGGLSALLERLHACAVRVHVVDLTRVDVGVPVVRAVAPELQPFAVSARTRRSDRFRRMGASGVKPFDAPLF